MLSDLISVSSGLVPPLLLAGWLTACRQWTRKNPHPVHRQPLLSRVLIEVPNPHYSSTLTPLFCLSCLKLVSWQVYSVSHADIQSSSRPSIPRGIQAVSHLTTHLGFPLSNLLLPHPETVGKEQDPFSEKKLLTRCVFSLHSSSSLSSLSLCLVFADRLVELFTNFLPKVFFIPSTEGSHSVRCFVFQNTKLLEIRRPSSQAYCSFCKFQEPFLE